MGSFKERPTVKLSDCQHLIDTKHLCCEWFPYFVDKTIFLLPARTINKTGHNQCRKGLKSIELHKSLILKKYYESFWKSCGWNRISPHRLSGDILLDLKDNYLARPSYLTCIRQLEVFGVLTWPVVLLLSIFSFICFAKYCGPSPIWHTWIHKLYKIFLHALKDLNIWL